MWSLLYFYLMETSLVFYVPRLITLPLLSLYNRTAVVSELLELATGINYADLTNSTLRMHGHISVGFFSL